MQVHYGIDSFKNDSNAVVTSGTFDGVHYGHQKIINRLIEIAKNSGGESVVITFWPHPRLVLNHDKSIKLLSTLEEKITLLDSFGIEHLLVIPFNQEFSKLSSEDFIQRILINAVGTKKLVIGYDHRFGKNREGGFEYLQENASRLGFVVEEIPKQEIEEIAVSSTKIRKALQEGRVETASHYLDRPYELTGKVIKGNQIGRTIGFPTANIQINDANKLIPKEGIYAVKIRVGGKILKGMLNIGKRPTVDEKGIKVIEANIFDFEEYIYDEEIAVLFYKFLRNEQKFSSLEDLKTQLKKDRKNTQLIFSGLE